MGKVPLGNYVCIEYENFLKHFLLWLFIQHNSPISEKLFRFRYWFRPKQKTIFGYSFGFGQKEKWVFRPVSVSAEIKKSLSVVHYSRL